MAAAVVAMEEEEAMAMEEGMAVREAMMTWVWGISMEEEEGMGAVAMVVAAMEEAAMEEALHPETRSEISR